MNIVLIVLLSLYVIAFLVFLWKSAAVWRWYHITLAVLLMILSITFLAPLAGVLKTRAAWNQAFQKIEKQRDDVKAEFIRLNEEDGGVQELQVELQKLSSESGRVWRHLEMQNVTPQGITLRQPEDPNAAVDPAAVDAGGAAAAPAAGSPLLSESLIVYGFAEEEKTIGDVTLPTPTVYLGEFTVLSSTPNEVVLKVTGTPTDRQRRAIESGAAAKWSLYELLPLDGHAPFLVEDSQPSNINMYGDVDEALINQLFGNRLLPETLDAYLKDGERFAEGSEMVDNSAADSDPNATADGSDTAGAQVRNEQLTRWSKIKFVKPYSETVDSTENRGAVDGGFFELGLAVDSRLKRIEGPTVKFSAGDEIYVTFEVANNLKDQGVAEILANFNVRSLNDYRFVLRRTDLRLDEVQDRVAQLTEQNRLLEESMKLTDAMNQKYQVDKSHLEADSNQITKERKAIAEYAAQLEGEIKSTKQQLAALYQSNLRLNEELKTYHQTVTEQTDARVRAAAP